MERKLYKLVNKYYYIKEIVVLDQRINGSIRRLYFKKILIEKCQEPVFHQLEVIKNGDHNSTQEEDKVYTNEDDKHG